MHREQTQEYRNYIKSSPEWMQIRELVKERDNHTCQICGRKHNLHVHHIRYEHLFNERNYPEDLLTVCDTCHDHIHRYFNVVDALREHYLTRRKEAEKVRRGRRYNT